MLAIILAMLVCGAAAAVVVGYVAVDARRNGREVLTAEGEEILASVRRQTDDVLDRGEDLARRTVAAVRPAK